MARSRELAWPLLAAALWGGMYVVSRLTFDSIPPVTLGLLRVLIGVTVLGLVLRRLPVLQEWRLVGLGALLAATMMLQFLGTDLAGAAAGSLLTLLTPVFVAGLAPFVLSERTSRRQWLGIGIALLGAIVVSGGGSGASLLGDVLLLAASLTWAAFTVFGAPLVRKRGALETTTGACLWAVPLMIPGTVIELAGGAHLAPTVGGVVGALYLGVFATALAWWAWYRGVERLPAATAAVFFLAQPVVGIALSIPIFHFPLTLGFAGGSLLVVIGMLLAT